MKSDNLDSIHLKWTSYGEGTPIVFLHGFGASSYTWHHLIKPLSPHYKLYLVDLKGFGSSPKPRDGKYSIFDQARLVKQFVQENHLDSYILAGHSYGGGVALALSVSYLNESQNPIKKLILVDNAAYPQTFPFFIKALRIPILGRLGLSIIPTKMNVKSVLNLAFFDKRNISTEMINEYSRALGMPGGKYALRQVARQILPPEMTELMNQYHNISIPVMIVWGRQDEVIPLEIGERLNHELSNSTLAVIENCGHHPHEEKPKEFIALVKDFLNADSTTSSKQ